MRIVLFILFAFFISCQKQKGISKPETSIQEKTKLIADAREQVEGITMNYNMGLITNNERYNQVIDVWTSTNALLTELAMKNIREDWRPISQGSKKIKTDFFKSLFFSNFKDWTPILSTHLVLNYSFILPTIPEESSKILLETYGLATLAAASTSSHNPHQISIP